MLLGAVRRPEAGSFCYEAGAVSVSNSQLFARCAIYKSRNMSFYRTHLDADRLLDASKWRYRPKPKICVSTFTFFTGFFRTL